MKFFDRVTYAPDDPPPAGGDQDTNNLGWRAALPDEYKTHDYVKTFQKPGDFVKSALEIKAERDGLTAKLGQAIFKPGENAKPEEISAYHKALGVPEKSDDYEFPKTEGVEHDPQMLSWARGMFHKAGLNKEQAGVISQGWDSFMSEMAKANDEAVKKGITEAETALKAEWKADYDKNLEITRRGYDAFEKVVPGFKDILELDTPGGKIGNNPVMTKVFHMIGKAIGDDLSIPGLPNSVPPKVEANFQSIYKVPNPPR